MIIKLNGLHPGINEITLSGDPLELSLPETKFRNQVDICFRLQDYGDLINSEFILQTVCHLVCDRCALDFEFPLKVNGRLCFIPHTGKLPPDSEGVKYFNPDFPQVDISQEVLDELMLALPVKTLCREDCIGLCPHCGADLNSEPCHCQQEHYDPRWQALTAIKNGLIKE